MSTFAVTSEQLTVVDHPNADALEVVRVGGYRAVVAKGAYRTGDWAVYIPEQAVLPDALIDELGLTGRLAGADRNRVKPVRLRGQLSQGIVCRPTALADVNLSAASAAGVDFAEQLGIVKWSPPIPTHMDGQLESAGDLLPWVDVENVKRYPDVFAAGEPVVATEKLHGTCCLVTHVAAADRLYVTSKGYGARRTAIVESDGNVYWQAVRGHGVGKVARLLADRLDAARVGIFGEVFGAGIQDLTYGVERDRRGYAAFDIAYEPADGGPTVWVDAADLPGLLDGLLPTAPVLYAGPYDLVRLWEVASGAETLSGDGTHVREGVVVRPATERFSEVLGGRAIVKFVSDAYLMRAGGTEFE